MPLLPPEQAAVAALLLFRLTGLVWVAPMFSGRTVPTALKVAVLALFTFLLFPAASAASGIGGIGGVGGGAGVPGASGASGATGAAVPVVNALTLLSEATVGLMLGLGAGMFVAAAESAGDLMAVQMGLSGANVVNPISETQMPILGQFMGLFVLTLILSTGGHLLIVGALARSLEVAPVGLPLAMDQGIATLVRMGGELFVLGLRFAAPVVATVMIGNAALGVMARTVPQLNVLMVAFPLQIAIGLFVLGATLPLMAGFFSSWPARFEDVAGSVLQALAPAPPGGA